MTNPGTILASFSTIQTHLTSDISMLLISMRRGISASFEQGQLVQKEKRLLSRTSAVISSTVSLLVFIRTAPAANPLPTEIWAVLQSESIQEFVQKGTYDMKSRTVNSNCIGYIVNNCVHYGLGAEHPWVVVVDTPSCYQHECNLQVDWQDQTSS
jgi:hypothetical protein